MWQILPMTKMAMIPVNAQWETTVDGHAGERETSAILAIRQELVRKEALKSDGEGNPLGRLKPLRDLGVDMGIWWYADYPSHYCGDGSYGTVEKGNRWLDAEGCGTGQDDPRHQGRYGDQAPSG